MPANKLRELVTEVIEEHIDEESYQETLRIEKLEKKTFDEVVNNWWVASNSHKGTNVGQLVQLMEPNNEGDASE